MGGTGSGQGQMSGEAARTFEAMLDATASLVYLQDELERVQRMAAEALGRMRRANGEFVRQECKRDTLSDLGGACGLVGNESTGALLDRVFGVVLGAGRGNW